MAQILWQPQLNHVQVQQDLVTDDGVRNLRASVMHAHPAFGKLQLATCMERVLVHSNAAAHVRDGAASAADGAMTAHQFGYSNTGEAFVAVQVHSLCTPCASCNMACCEMPRCITSNCFGFTHL